MWRSCTSTTPGARASRSPTARVSIPLGAASSRIAVESRRIDHELTRTSTPIRTLTSGSASSQPVVRMTTAADDDPDRAQDVGNDVPERGLDVEIAAAAAKQDRAGGEVDCHSDQAYHQHPASEHVGRVTKALVRLVEDPDRERHQRDPVGERRQDLRTLVPVRSLRCRRPFGEPDGEEGERERDVVGEHVHRVGEEGQAPGREPADDLDHGVDGRDRECERECSAAAAPRVGVIVAHVRVLPARHDLGGLAVFRTLHPRCLEAVFGQGIIQRVRVKLLAIVGVIAFASAVVVVASARTTANGLPSYTDGWQTVAPDQHEAVHQHGPALERPLGRQERLREQAQGRLEVPERHRDREDDRQARHEVRRASSRRCERSNGRWRFIEYERSSAAARYSLLAQGSLCQGCHVMAKSNDFVFTKR